MAVHDHMRDMPALGQHPTDADGSAEEERSEEADESKDPPGSQLTSSPFTATGPHCPRNCFQMSDRAISMLPWLLVLPFAATRRLFEQNLSKSPVALQCQI